MNIYWHPWFGPVFSTLGCLEVSMADNSSIVWPGASKAPAPLIFVSILNVFSISLLNQIFVSILNLISVWDHILNTMWWGGLELCLWPWTMGRGETMFVSGRRIYINLLNVKYGDIYSHFLKTWNNSNTSCQTGCWIYFRKYFLTGLKNQKQGNFWRQSPRGF